MRLLGSSTKHTGVLSYSFSEVNIMTFRKDSLSFYANYVICSMFVISSLAIIPIMGLVVAIICMFPFAVLLIMNHKLKNEFITVNENGISCHNSKKQLWAYEWDDIYQLRSVSHYRLPAIGVATYYKYAKCGEPDFYIAPNCYFQLGKKAKEALALYNSYTVHLLNQ